MGIILVAEFPGVPQTAFGEAAMIRLVLPSTAFIVFSASLAFSFQPDAPPPDAAATGQAMGVDPLLLQPPKTREDIEARVKLAQQRLEALRPTTQPATQPTTAPADEPQARISQARAALYQGWQAYLAQLERLASLQENLASLSSEQHVRELTGKIQQLQETTAEVKRQPPPPVTSDEQLAGVTAQYQELDGQLLSLNELQTRRAAQLATGFRQQREKLEGELTSLRQRRQELLATIDAPTTTAPFERETHDLERKLLDVQVAQTEVMLAALAVEKEQTEVAARQDTQYLESLRAHAAALRQRLVALTEARSRSALELIALERQQAKQPYEIALLDLKYLRESVLLTHFQNKKLLNALKDRLPASALDRLRGRVTMSAAMWDELVAYQQERTGQEAMELRAEARQDWMAYQVELLPLQAKLGRSLSELHELQKVRDRVLRRFTDLAQELTEALESAEPSVRTRMETEATTLRSSTYESMESVIGEFQSVIARLREGVSLVHDYTAKLHVIEKRLYWTALKRRESGLAGLDWPLIRGELRQVFGLYEEAVTPPTDIAGPPVAAAGGPVEEADVRKGLESRLHAFAQDLRGVPRRSWILMGSALVLTIGLAMGLRVYAKRRVRRLAKAITPGQAVAEVPAGRYVSERINMLGWKLLRDASIPIGIGLVCWGAPWILDLAARTWNPITRMIGLAVATCVAVALVRALFEPKRPHHRILPCSDTAARHYRDWLVALLLFSAIVLSLPLFAYVISIAPGIRSLLWECFKTGVLFILLLFLIRKDRVMGIAGQSRGHWIWPLISALYPLVFIGVLTLLVLQIVGYGMLVEFIGTRILATLAILILAGVVIEYVCDLLYRHSARDAVSLSQDSLQDPPGVSPTARSRATQTQRERDGPVGEEAGRVAHSVRAVGTLLRLAGVVLVALLILRVWGIPVFQSRIDWKPIGLGALVIAVAMVVDRLAYAALHTLYLSGRIPANTGNIMRRWLRGLLGVVVTLFLIALAGYQMDNVWTLLTGLTAMIAIGFVALWSVLSNVMATLIILVWRPFNVGEQIEIQPEGISGEVVDINFMYTLLKSEADERTTVPNSLFMQKFIRRKAVKRKTGRSLAQQLEAERPLHE